ncbi:predicted protein [Nematostella vectensis]|uniref:Uncharacterized protein n=1 Tax=Nematostella vectensis TaxID=45351 RepID=A7S7U2_NEMVE|nr:predicted protein [Nematostella vectensis]|eukprot:XP_001632362.1 predicted protein [Nematostella vectensis]
MEVHRSLVVVVLLVVQYIGLVLFLKGFFPIKQAIPGSASLSSFPPEPGSDAPGSPVDAVLDRLVIVLIDALRADFVLPGDGRMKYLNELVRNNESLRITFLLPDVSSHSCRDSHKTSALHLAAMAGNTRCVQLLLDSGHPVDCLDKYGWPPLLYANFKAQESCVLALMKPKPEQLFVLGDLLKKPSNEAQKEKTFKVVKNALISLANHDAYYTVFNDFIRRNPEMLEENNHGLLQCTWRAILDFDNKRRWFRAKIRTLK